MVEVRFGVVRSYRIIGGSGGFKVFRSVECKGSHHQILVVGVFCDSPDHTDHRLAQHLVCLFDRLIRLFVVAPTSEVTQRIKTLRARVPVVFYVWVVFLLLFPLFAPESNVAWRSLRSDWAPCVITWGLGFSAVILLGTRGPALSTLIWASSLPVVLHLFLCLLAWSGVFGGPLPGHLTVSQIGQALKEFLSPVGFSHWQWQPFPWGFRGFDPMHGNLGYAASQTVALLVASLYLHKGAGGSRRLGLAVMGIALCILSTLIASSRGAVLFSAVLLVIAGGAYLRQVLKGRAVLAQHGQSSSLPFLSRRVTLVVAVLLAVLGVVSCKVVQTDTRWATMVDKVRVGWSVEHPIEFLCSGMSSDFESHVRAMVGNSESYQNEILEGLRSQDGGRIVLMQAALRLVAEHPWGIDGSRETFQKLIAKQCGHTPIYLYSHSHQAWLDMALGLGWLGALLFAAVLGSFACFGWRTFMGRGDNAHWGFALFLITIFWIGRGFADAVYREHYLQMQGFLIAYLFGRMVLAEKPQAT
jgi:hypothetical protein